MNLKDAVAAFTADELFLKELDNVVSRYENESQSDDPTDLEVGVMLKMGHMIHVKFAGLLEREPTVEDLATLSQFLQELFEHGLRN